MAEEPYSNEEFVTVFSSAEHSAEIEADSIHSLLESAGLESLIVRENVQELPVGRVAVRVLASHAGEARAIIAAAQKAGAESGDAGE